MREGHDSSSPLCPQLAAKSLRRRQPKPNCPHRSFPLPRHAGENPSGLRPTSHFGARLKGSGISGCN